MNFALASDADAETEHHMAPYLGVVADVHLVHEIVVVANGRGLVSMYAARDDDILTDVVAVADSDMSRLPFLVVEILWGATDDGVLKDDVVIAHTRAVEYGGMGLDDAVVADDNVTFDVGKRTDFYVFAELGFGVYVG